MSNEVEKIKLSKKVIDEVLGTETEISHRAKTKYDIDKRKFENIISCLEQIELRTNLLQADFAIDLTKYEDIYISVIYDLFELLYGPEIVKLIKFYVYNIINKADKVMLNDGKGKEIVIHSSSQLYDIIQHLLKNG